MTPLRAKYIRDLVIRGRSKHTQEAYIRYVCDLARYYRRSPEKRGGHGLAVPSHQGAPIVSLQRQHRRQRRALSLRRYTWARDARLDGIGPAHEARHPARGSLRLRSEVEAILTAPRQPRDRVLLMTVYGCGLRISEATQLKTSDIDRARMQLRVRDGKGAKGRVLPLTPIFHRPIQIAGSIFANRPIMSHFGQVHGAVCL